MTKEDIISAIETSNTYSEVLRKLNLKTHTGARKTLLKYIKEYNIDDSILKEKSKNFIKNNISNIKKMKYKISDLDFFIENSNHIDSKTLRTRLLKLGIQYECSICEQKPIHNNIPLTLQVDHINGIHNDNRIENLRFLCPNCHTQTPTWGKKRKKKIHICSNCDNKYKGFGNFCKNCANKITQEKYRKFEVSKEELEKLVKSQSIVAISKIYDVSDNTIRKRCKLFGIDCSKYKK